MEVSYFQKILIVDDALVNINLLTRILASEGHHIFAAENGQMALDIARHESPNLILLDINMPILDGYATCEALKMDPRTSAIPVIFISALSELEDKVRAFKVGAVDYISKPFQVDEVLARVKAHLAISQLQVRLEDANHSLARQVAELTRSQKLLQKTENQLRAFISALPNLSFIYDEDGKYIEILSPESKLLTAPTEKLEGRSISDLLPHQEAELILGAIRHAIESKKTHVIEYKLPVISGDEHWFEARIAYMGPGDHGKEQVVFTAAEITERVELYQEVQRLAIQDPLTGCLNRRHFFKLSVQELLRATRYQRPISLIMFDIDHFKRFNDSFGHPAGDQLLISLVKLCEKQLRSTDLLGRYGGEEFLILLPETDQQAAKKTGERLRKAIEKMSIETMDGPKSTTVSMGLVCYHGNMHSQPGIDDLILCADKAMYQAKNAGRNNIQVIQNCPSSTQA